MRLNFILLAPLLAPLLALAPLACGSVGDSTSGGNSNGTSSEATGTASTGSGSNSTGNGGASSGSASTGNGSASTGSASTGNGGASTGSASTGSASTGSAGTGTASTGSASTGSASTGSASTGSASTGSAGTGSASTGSASTGSAGTGSASTGSASTGSASTGSASTGTASSGTASTGTGGSGACSGYIDVIAPTGGSQHFATVCEGAWGANETSTALGYQFSGGVPPGFIEFDILGCATAGAASSGVRFSALNATATGTFVEGGVSYIDVNGGAWSNTADPYKVVITKLDAPGGVVEGTFSAMVIGPGDTKLPISGTFHVCRVADLNAP